MNFAVPDAAPTDELNRILWHAAKGWGARYPTAKQSVFFPMSVDLQDDERTAREERKERKPPRKP